MGLFGKLFGSDDPLAAVRQAVKQQRWADARRQGERLDRQSLSSDAAAELASLMALAGDTLAGINLNEGEACRRAGDESRAVEHFQLAAAHACAPSLQERARELLQGPSGITSPSESPLVVAAGCCSVGCASQSPAESFDEAEDLDWETRLELVLSSYPEGWSERYLKAATAFKQALLSAHDGFEAEALAAFDQVSESDRDDLFYFERGALLLRMGETRQGRASLEQAIELNDRHLLALELLTQLDLAEAKAEDAEQRLHAMLTADLAPAFCLSRLAMIYAGRNDEVATLDYCEQALQVDAIDGETLLLLSSLFEKFGRLDRAEQLLASLSGGGCAGTVNLFLAEFQLRHGRSLEKALEIFKAACRSEPANLRWVMRIAQVYLRLGWVKEGREMIEKVLAAPGIDDILRHEAEEILRFGGK